MITERTLKKWRREALQLRNLSEGDPYGEAKLINECTERILCMTQELLDQHLLRIKK